MKQSDLKNAFAPIPQDVYEMIVETTHSVKEEPIVKRKLTVSLAIALAAMLALVGVAFAIAHFTDYADQIVAMENEKGYYRDWDAQDRTELVRILVESGVLPEDARVQSLLSGTLDDAAASALATEIIVDWGPSQEDIIGLMSILETVWGDMPFWTLEQKLWYQQKSIDAGEFHDDWQRLLPPGEDDLPMETAIATARAAIEEAFGLDADALDAATVAAEFYIMPGAEDTPNWFVAFRRENAEVGMREFHAVVSGQTGEVIADPLLGTVLPEESARERAQWREEEAARAADPVFMAVDAFYARHDGAFDFYSLSLEAKADFSANVRPLILEAIETNPETYADNNYLPMDYTVYVYGLPDEAHISESEALQRAKEAILAEQPIEADVLAVYQPNTYFDITDPDKPLWRFYFNAYSGIYDLQETLPDDAWERGYRVELDAVTGEVVSLWVDSKVSTAGETLLRFL